MPHLNVGVCDDTGSPPTDVKWAINRSPVNVNSATQSQISSDKSSNISGIGSGGTNFAQARGGGESF